MIVFEIKVRKVPIHDIQQPAELIDKYKWTCWWFPSHDLSTYNNNLILNDRIDTVHILHTDYTVVRIGGS